MRCQIPGNLSKDLSQISVEPDPISGKRLCRVTLSMEQSSLFFLKKNIFGAFFFFAGHWRGSIPAAWVFVSHIMIPLNIGVEGGQQRQRRC